jgi:hypothetical protein
MNFSRIPEVTELWVACGTKFGKTLSGTVSYCVLAPRLNEGIIRHVAPIYKQSRIGLKLAKRFLPGKPHTKVHLADNQITFTDRKKEQVIEYWHGQDPESLEGEGVIFYLLDETSKMKQGVYTSARTTLTQTNGILAAFSTPRGKGWFHGNCMNAKAEMLWCLRKGINPTKIFIHAPTSENPFVYASAIEYARKNLPDRLFRQYYLAEFLESGEIFPYFKDSLYGEELFFEYESQLWLHPDHAEQEQIIIGADWGKENDFTVFTAWSVSSNMMMGFMRFRGIDYISAIKNLVWFAGNYKLIMIVKHDKTGLGNVIDDALAGTELPYEGIVFTNANKSEMVNALMIAFQRRTPRLPNWPAMVEELDNFEVQVSDIGNFKYGAAQGFHDDIVCSMILGWSGVDEYAPTRMEIVSLEDLSELDLNNELEPTNQDFSQWLAATK